jgi:hypothetical protein
MIGNTFTSPMEKEMKEVNIEKEVVPIEEYTPPTESEYLGLTEQQVQGIRRKCFAEMSDALLMPCIEFLGYSPEDGFGGWDDDGRVDCVSFRGTYELMYSREAVINVLINAGANRETAARVLKMQAQWLKDMTYEELESLKPTAPKWRSEILKKTHTI